MDLAHKAAALYRSVKIGNRWTFRAVDGKLSVLSEGAYYLSYNDGTRPLDPLSPDPEYALRMLEKKRLELAFIAAGGEVKVTISTPKALIPEPQVNLVPETKTIRQAVTEYLAYCLTRQGQSGYDLGRRTTEAYTYRLGFLLEFRPDACLNEIDGEFIRQFLAFLRSHTRDLPTKCSPPLPTPLAPYCPSIPFFKSVVGGFGPSHTEKSTWPKAEPAIVSLFVPLISRVVPVPGTYMMTI
jgi:hypothetical protein